MGKHQPGLEVSLHGAPEVYVKEQEPLYVQDHNLPNFPVQLDTTYQAIDLQNQAPHLPNNSKAQENTICGLRAGRFRIITAIAAMTVVAAVVGGGVGDVLAAGGSWSDTNEAVFSETSSPVAPNALTSATSTSTSSSSTTPSISPYTPFPTVGLLALDYPSIDETRNSTIASGTRYTFEYHCGNDIHGSNLQMSNSTDIKGCVEQCAEYNADSGSNRCFSVV
ncbi:hypothetical protein Hte_006455 [Hypoxylon texense]